ncbi:MAG: methyltransferase [Candidatus Methanoperedens nitroreducens]|uniref:Methyltransferase n=1 Tax=Candidatus Methanoperedens nitratireducens TaxID=1392998 RepID=A0A0P8ACV3_9EURY|nr:class I SAM-dependent methyltransferase [Candidatus Methanoperedens sp. BLZ2]KAB2946580.1 MAG: class I SAM-dependent methyltransferase [Candidatus Methanoperedens sp.]KPQ41945.1 MAG: methyltransferase [Candidatus Methanoperedens sp. BLZ1]MBZ0175085.1 class I SAM-dependent methyltransferase [Candidatus Methanoperedens nitroreducens]
MLAGIENYIKKQAFFPTIPGIFLNPFYISRINLLQNIKKNIHFFDGGYLLDVGCGRKPYESLFNVTSYIGLDIAGGGHDDDAKSADVYYDGKVFPFIDSFFDYVISNQVLEHVLDQEQLMKEIYRVLKPDGLLLITAPFVWDEHEAPYDYWRYTSFGLNYFFSKKGFGIIEQYKSGNYIETLVQMFSSYIYTIFLTKNRYLNVLISIFLCSPILIFGLILSKVLPKNKNLYLDNVILARKR